MHYTDINFKTKKLLKERVAARMAYLNAQTLAAETGPMTVGALVASKVRPVNPVTVHNPETFCGEAPTPENGTVCVGGPHEYHRWYATVTLKNGEVIKVK